MNFEDNILLKLKRKYSKDEEVSFILKRLKDSQYKNGLLKSELSELQDENKNLRKLNNDLKNDNKRHIEFSVSDEFKEIFDSLATDEKRCTIQRVEYRLSEARKEIEKLKQQVLQLQIKLANN